MEKVSMYSCVNTPITTPGVNRTDNTPYQTGVFSTFRAGNTNQIDTVNFRSKKDIYVEKINKLFPNGELQQVYDKINKDFGLDRPAHLRMVCEDDGVQAGGFTFSKNEIVLSMSDLLDSDTKVVGIKNGKRVVLTSPKNQLPLFVDKKSAEAFVAVHSQHGNLGFDRLEVEPVTKDEQKKLIVQKIAHEVIHAQQHMYMRQTEGIGEKEIFKAWTHIKPKNLIDKAVLDYKTNDSMNKSYWAGEPETEKTISADSTKGHLAKIWLEAVRNYPPVDSPEYEKNAIEVDAYTRSAEYLKQNYGWY